MSCARGDVYIGIAMMYHMESPHELDFMQQEMNDILR